MASRRVSVIPETDVLFELNLKGDNKNMFLATISQSVLSLNNVNLPFYLQKPEGVKITNEHDVFDKLTFFFTQ